MIPAHCDLQGPDLSNDSTCLRTVAEICSEWSKGDVYRDDWPEVSSNVAIEEAAGAL